MFKGAVKGTGWAITKIIIAIAAFALGIYQLIFAGNMMLFDNENVGSELTPANYETVKDGEQVWGKIDNIIGVEYLEDTNSTNSSLNYYMVKSDNDKIMFFRTPIDSKCDYAMQRVLSGQSKEFYFKGYVKPMTQAISAALSMGMLADNTLRGNNINGTFDEVVIKRMVDASPYDTYVDKNKIIIASVVGAVFMFFIVILCLKKMVKEVAYSIGVSRGKIKPLMPEVDYNPRDTKLTFYSDFEGDRNALSQGYNLRKCEFAPEKINAKQSEEVEYYTDYDKDSIDFTKEEKRVTIYGEEYQKPTLEKDIATYDGYEYDSLDFAQEPVEKKDISRF